MIAAVLRELIAAGVTGDALVAAIERIEKSMDTRSAGAKRQARYRANKASQNVTRDGSDACDAPPPQVSPSSSSPTPPITPSPSSPSCSSLRSEVVGSAEPTRSPRKYSPAFEGWWLAYPKTPVMSKKQAADAWMKLTDADRLRAVSALSSYRTFLAGKPDHPVVHACRFLSQRRFDGFAEVEAASTGPPKPPAPGLPTHEELLQRYAKNGPKPQGEGGEVLGESAEAHRDQQVGGGDRSRVGGMGQLGALLPRILRVHADRNDGGAEEGEPIRQIHGAGSVA